MTDPLSINGCPVVTLQADGDGPGVVRADIAPGRGMLLLQARGRMEGVGEFDILHAPPPAEAARLLNAGAPDDFAGNLAFSFGGAILLPFANRIRGRNLSGSREIETEVGGRTVRLPRNWGGKASGAEQYAMHGLILDTAPDDLHQPGPDRLRARLALGDFGGRWPSQTFADVEWALEGRGLRLTVDVKNVGDDLLPMGVGWHPYFALKSGDRRQARLRLPAHRRLLVSNYDEVLPTGETAPVGGTPYDFTSAQGAALDDLYLDDCFVDLSPASGRLTADVLDPAGGYGVRVTADAPPVRAVQVYAPPDKAFVVLEPQLNWPDPFGAEWAGAETGMAMLQRGESLTFGATLELCAPA